MHEKAVHMRNEKEYKCEICEMNFPLKNQIALHLQEIHDINGKTFECAECNKGFSSKIYFYMVY